MVKSSHLCSILYAFWILSVLLKSQSRSSSVFSLPAASSTGKPAFWSITLLHLSFTACAGALPTICLHVWSWWFGLCLSGNMGYWCLIGPDCLGHLLSFYPNKSLALRLPLQCEEVSVAFVAWHRWLVTLWNHYSIQVPWKHLCHFNNWKALAQLIMPGKGMKSDCAVKMDVYGDSSH